MGVRAMMIWKTTKHTQQMFTDKLTVSENEYGPMADIWSKVGVLWGGLMYPKRPANPISS